MNYPNSTVEKISIEINESEKKEYQVKIKDVWICSLKYRYIWVTTK